MKYLFTAVYLLFFFHCEILCQDLTPDDPIEIRHCGSERISDPPSIDGLLNEEIWSRGEWTGDYVQQIPQERATPSQATKFKVFYDDKFLYIGARCYDTEPDKIVRRMSRRDGFEGDWVEFNIDSYHDLRTAFSFTISATGVKGDEFVTNDGNNWDGSWNPIWYADTNIDAEGWTAEIKIPLSQLRYGNQEEHIWGLQSTRLDFRTGERSIWQYIPQNSGRWVSGFGKLEGLKGVKPQKQIEIQPYVVLKNDSYEKEEGNPFRDGSDFSMTTGLDGKIGVTSDLVLDFTINPDFGQVEADPAQLRLDGFEAFFNEQRPFFVENRNLFEGGHHSSILFYSRRIGGNPKGYPSLNDDDYTDVPENATILGAAKLSGKTKKGLSIGILESVTAREMAKIENTEGEKREETVEPLTNYFVGRMSQDFREGNTVLGGMITATNRKLDGTDMDWLHKSAYSGGLDLIHRWNDRKMFINAKTFYSNVRGTQESILDTQTSLARNYQRPDAEHLNVDSTATALSGYGGAFVLGRNAGNRKINFEAGLKWNSPGLELNDIGFINETDQITQSTWLYYKIGNPFAIFNNMRFNYSVDFNYDFGGQLRFIWMQANTHAQFKNFWGYGIGANVNMKNLAKAALRGGPSLVFNDNFSMWTYIYSDGRKKLFFELNPWMNMAGQNTNKTFGGDLTVRYRPFRTVELRVAPGYTKSRRAVQYVSNVDRPDGIQYVNSKINQETFSVSLRVDYTILPNLTIQYYGQPFISKGIYSDFLDLKDPLEKDFYKRFDSLSGLSYDEMDEIYSVDENGDNVTDYTFDNPDFVYMQFRSNLVARWEYIPGSELFFVWSQGTTQLGNNPSQDLLASLENELFSDQLRNTFLIKATYRFLK